MKTKEEIFQEENGFGLINDNESITLTKEDIYNAMERYAQQFQELNQTEVRNSACD